MHASTRVAVTVWAADACARLMGLAMLTGAFALLLVAACSAGVAQNEGALLNVPGVQALEALGGEPETELVRMPRDARPRHAPSERQPGLCCERAFACACVWPCAEHQRRGPRILVLSVGEPPAA